MTWRAWPRLLLSVAALALPLTASAQFHSAGGGAGHFSAPGRARPAARAFAGVPRNNVPGQFYRYGDPRAGSPYGRGYYGRNYYGRNYYHGRNYYYGGRYYYPYFGDPFFYGGGFGLAFGGPYFYGGYPYYDYYGYNGYTGAPVYEGRVAPETAPGQTRPSGDRENSLTAGVQRALREKGYYRGSVDGEFGSASRSALRRFQEDRNLNATGRLDQATLDALGFKTRR